MREKLSCKKVVEGVKILNKVNDLFPWYTVEKLVDSGDCNVLDSDDLYDVPKDFTGIVFCNECHHKRTYVFLADSGKFELIYPTDEPHEMDKHEYRVRAIKEFLRYLTDLPIDIAKELFWELFGELRFSWFIFRSEISDFPDAEFIFDDETKTVYHKGEPVISF